jgi:FKBP-type peptidyl-prolyl cis-trans isomerase
MSEIKVRGNSFFRSYGRKCLPFDYFTVHYKAYIDNNNTALEYMDKVLDSRVKGQGKPITFRGGYYQVAKCWDMTLPLMHAGETITLECPSHFALGG